MEVFSLLKYWRTNGGATDANVRTTPSTTTTIRHVADETDDDNDADDGPFFDLEFAVPEDDVGEEEEEENESDVSESESEEDEVDFTVDSSCSTGNRTDPNLTLSPSDDLFFNGRFVPLEPFNSTESQSKLQFPGSLLKPATKLRVLMLGFKRPKSIEVEKKSSLTVKLEVEEVPVVSLFTRDNSSRKIKQQAEEVVASEEKKFAKDVLQKYLKMVKPLYFRVSKKYGEKANFSGQLSLNSTISKIETEIKEIEVNPSCVNIKSQREGNLTAGLRNVRKHLGKSRSASSAVAAAPSLVQSRRHDDSLLQQQDGIQSAILHCKRSFTASRDSDSSSLSRCTSDPSHENSSRSSLDETRVK